MHIVFTHDHHHQFDTHFSKPKPRLMLRSAVTRAARATASAAHGASQQQQSIKTQITNQQTDAVATLVRHFSASRFAVDGAMSKKQQDGCYSRIAAKLSRSNLAVSIEVIDRTVAFLQHVGLSKSLALSAVAMHPMVTVVTLLLTCRRQRYEN